MVYKYLKCVSFNPSAIFTVSNNKNISEFASIIKNTYSIEIRILECFLKNPDADVPLLDRDIDMMHLVNDRLIKDDGVQRMNSIGLVPKQYLLTDTGKKFIQRWQAITALDGTEEQG